MGDGDMSDGVTAEALAEDDALFNDALARLCLAQELYSRLGGVVGTRGGTLRALVDEAARVRSDRGEDRRRVVVDGAQVGTYTMVRSKEEPEKLRQRFVVSDLAALGEWESDDFDAWLTTWTRDNLPTLAKAYFEAVGELPGGCELADEVVPARPSRFRNGLLRPDGDAIQAVFGRALPQAVAGLLGGGGDEA